MLEFKNVSVVRSDGRLSEPVSAVMDRGEVLCICGGRGTGKSRLLLAVLGLVPVGNGYITVEGEQVSTGSAHYFRQLMAYVPQQVPDVDMTVEQLCHTTLHLGSDKHDDKQRNLLMEQWKALGIEESLYQQSILALSHETLQLVMLSMLPLLHRKVVLIDQPPCGEAVSALIRRLADEGAEVVCTCEERPVACDKMINI